MTEGKYPPGYIPLTVHQLGGGVTAKGNAGNEVRSSQPKNGSSSRRSSSRSSNGGGPKQRGGGGKKKGGPRRGQRSSRGRSDSESNESSVPVEV